MTFAEIAGISTVMNALLNKAITALQKLPDKEQEAIARDVLDQLAADDRWRDLLSDPRSAGVLEKLAEEARRDIAAGRVSDRDPSNS